MKLASLRGGGFGRVEGDRFVPMGEDLVAYLEPGEARDGDPRPLAEVRLGPPVPRPSKIVCVGLNYRDHAAETGQPLPEEPILFPKFANSVIGPDDDVVVPAATEQPDLEAELGVVIGRRATAVGEDEALAHVGGYTCTNDVSARDLQFRTSQWMAGKAIDTFFPMGPWIVTPDEIPDPQALRIRALVDGAVRQDSSTSEMVFPVRALVAYISRTITLEPGDVIATGTPPGVGMSRTPPVWLHDGEDVTVEIERIGALRNHVRASARDGGAG